jgi:hypothetical protein
VISPGARASGGQRRRFVPSGGVDRRDVHRDPGRPDLPAGDICVCKNANYSGGRFIVPNTPYGYWYLPCNGPVYPVFAHSEVNDFSTRNTWPPEAIVNANDRFGCASIY